MFLGKKTSHWSWCVVFLLGWGLAAPRTAPAQVVSPAPPLVVQEELLGEKDPGTPAQDDEDTVSPDGRRVAWRAKRGKKWVAVVNGQEQGSQFDEVRWLIFSPDSQHLAYRGKRGKKWMLVLDGQEQGIQHDAVAYLRFKPASSLLSYASQRGKKWLVVLDGKEGPQYDDVGRPIFTRDGGHIAYPAKRRKKWVMVADGQEQPFEFDDITVWMFSPDGQRLAYVGRRKADWLVVVDTQGGPAFDIVGGLTFSPDSRRFAYAGVGTGWALGGEKAAGMVVIDRQQGPVFKATLGSTGKSVLGVLGGMSVREEFVKGYFDRLWPAWHGVSSPAFSPDSRHIAYAARRGKNEVVVMLGGEPGPQFEAIVGGPVFSPDSEQVAYVAAEKGTVNLVLGTTKVAGVARKGRFLSSLDYEERPSEFASYLAFSPDSRRVAYLWVRGGSFYARRFTQRARRQVFLDGQPGKEYDAIAVFNLTFSPDSQHLAYDVHDIDGGRSLVVVDGQEGKHYDQVMSGSLSFSGDNLVTYMARAGRKFYRVTQTPASLRNR